MKHKAVSTCANDVLILIKVSVRNGTCLRSRWNIWIIIKQYKITPTLKDNAAFGLLGTEFYVLLLNGTVTDTELERTTIWSWRNLRWLVGIFLQGWTKPQHSHSGQPALHRDLKPGLPKYETRDMSTHPRHTSVCICPQFTLQTPTDFNQVFKKSWPLFPQNVCFS
jgi:hypothetical protein